jgi:hypothetical protein
MIIMYFQYSSILEQNDFKILIMLVKYKCCQDYSKLN